MKPKNSLRDSLSIPRDLVWSVEDWKDLYETLRRFKARLLKRHGIETTGKRKKK